ncbi:heterokaryon incompatibility protein-domain-containing protein [Immersiella caudata]|uniref:Heterokaryon incompatibility protein-domain-containing protein n=1 Tax=Immersiella caudata TaxID=314043 RepID=A0AA39WVK0_9PEZI|nr:heterokaryon incompatibility protein-domain-containing protein [Immersiella caudata]
MRLLDVDTLEIEEFYGTDKPRYAILSHTWGKEEISFPDMLAIRAAADTRHPLRRKRGFHKIINTCEQARRDGYRHVWVDTCCIDKSSSSELSEAINSMFAWYQESDMCYAYLEDFSITNDFGQPNPKDTIVKSRWFSRGWTLQELLAPRRITFFHTFWESLGTKASLAAAIEGGTGISQDVLLNPDLIRNYSISERMVWATNRQTTRLEDRAYSLIGIFGVNMPLLYGEGEKAFMRLQEEIIKGSEDQTIFAWRGSGDPWFDDIAHVKEDTKSSVAPNDLGVLALSPDAFIGCGGIIPLLDFDYTRSTFMFTNRGLQINLPLVELSSGYCIGVPRSGAC